MSGGLFTPKSIIYNTNGTGKKNIYKNKIKKYRNF